MKGPARIVGRETASVRSVTYAMQSFISQCFTSGPSHAGLGCHSRNGAEALAAAASADKHRRNCTNSRVAKLPPELAEFNLRGEFRQFLLPCQS